VVSAIKGINEAGLLGNNNELTFSLDRSTRQMVIKIVDRVSGEVVEQIPRESVVRLAENLHQPKR
jgi:uncharacterized FlaG/YvyC family protein